MIAHPELSVLVIAADHKGPITPWLAFLDKMPHVEVVQESRLASRVDAFSAIVTERDSLSADDADRLIAYTKKGGGWLALAGFGEKPLPEVFGAVTTAAGPDAELRVLFQDANHPMAVRLADCVYVNGRQRPLQIAAEDTETILYADWHYTHMPVLVNRRFGAGRLACTTLQDFSTEMVQQILYRLLRKLAGLSSALRNLGVGILGYAPSVGKTHGLSVGHTAGLNLKAACDLNPERLHQAEQDFPRLTLYSDASALAENPDVDLVIVATPPNTHARLCLEMMAAGKHVLCEKPLALNRKETDRMLNEAEKQGVHLSCHQNRRWDPDFLAIRQVLQDNLIGDLFYLETFVGGFGHPCGYWHSHAAVSGGMTYDWGAHYIDWIVGLMGSNVAAVSGTRHKRVWHDVTNADQERIQIRFADGREAEFLHSDIAAIRKPKWYLLGTRGAIVGNWSDVTTFEHDPDFYFNKHDIPATEMMPDITVLQRRPGGELVRSKPALPEREVHRFHANLADHLLLGEPLAAPLTDSVKVVAILEAAARSMANGGKMEVFND